MFNNAKNFIVVFGIFLVLDAIWLVLTKGFYAANLGHLMGTNVKWIGAGIFYVLFIIALMYFVINPALQTHDLRTLIISAILFGLITYGTYDLTNYATLRDWPLTITVIDMIWGSSATLLVSLISYMVLR